MGSIKYAENLVATNIAKHTGLRSGTEVKFRDLVWVVALVRSQIQLCRGCGRETERKRLKIFYCSFKTYLNIYNNYVLQQWAVEEKELLIKA